jgi:hypothetical protein
VAVAERDIMVEGERIVGIAVGYLIKPDAVKWCSDGQKMRKIAAKIHNLFVANQLTEC